MHVDLRPVVSPPTPSATRALLAGIVDYAGLFPPAGLALPTAVANYASYCLSPDGWALGRFIVPVERLGETGTAVGWLGPRVREGRWWLTALPGDDWAAALDRIRDFNERGGDSWGEVDALEFRGDDPVEIRERLGEVPRDITAYVEIPTDRDPSPLVEAVREAGGRAKVRTGGVTPDAFPPPDALLRFLLACTDVDLPFKATGGLHHPVAGRYRLTYEPESPSAPMYGYLNLLFATALLRRGAPERHAATALAETEPDAFHLTEDSVAWRDEHLTRYEIETLRERGMVSFGSCSFREPMDELPARAGRASSAAPRPTLQA